ASGPGMHYEKNILGVVYSHDYGEKPRVKIPLPNDMRIRPHLLNGDNSVYLVWEKKLGADMNFVYPSHKKDIKTQSDYSVVTNNSKTINNNVIYEDLTK